MGDACLGMVPMSSGMSRIFRLILVLLSLIALSIVLAGCEGHCEFDVVMQQGVSTTCIINLDVRPEGGVKPAPDQMRACCAEAKSTCCGGSDKIGDTPMSNGIVLSKCNPVQSQRLIVGIQTFVNTSNCCSDLGLCGVGTD
mmetsp:Transcript_130610/g.325914  ORF Transcript_130610/g.325914 Transcript_130610/m.325914 type:complete len:141 (+) Transcript_130610:31-453(+)